MKPLHWPRVNSITDYAILILPLEKEVSALSPDEASRYFASFMAAVPHRSRYLMQQVTGDPQYVPETYEPESLISVWKWFLGRAEIVRDEETGQRMLSLVTEYILQDIGMYLGALWVDRHPGLSWGYDTGSEDMFVNRPVIQGFADRRYTPPFRMVFDPVHMAGVQAAKLLQGHASKKDLFDLYTRWCSFVGGE